MAHGGVFAWPDGRENPDTFQALLEYPKGFLASYSTSFGNDCDSFSRIMGKKATLVNIGGEGSPRWKVVEEKGNHEDNPTIERAERWVTLPGDDKPGPITSATRTFLTCRTGSNACGAAQADERDRRQRISARRSPSSWPRNGTGRENGCITIQRPSRSWTAHQPTDAF